MSTIGLYYMRQMIYISKSHFRSQNALFIFTQIRSIPSWKKILQQQFFQNESLGLSLFKISPFDFRGANVLGRLSVQDQSLRLSETKSYRSFSHTHFLTGLVLEDKSFLHVYTLKCPNSYDFVFLHNVCPKLEFNRELNRQVPLVVQLLLPCLVILNYKMWGSFSESN